MTDEEKLKTVNEATAIADRLRDALNRADEMGKHLTGLGEALKSLRDKSVNEANAYDHLGNLPTHEDAKSLIAEVQKLQDQQAELDGSLKYLGLSRIEKR
jgi:predicted  nucleic acid-binding Zn-ribbon protein